MDILSHNSFSFWIFLSWIDKYLYAAFIAWLAYLVLKQFFKKQP